MSARTAQLLLVLALFAAAGGAVTGCGSEQGSGRGAQARAPGHSPVAEARAREVADAWDGSEAARAWRKGYYPIGEVVQLPEDAFHDAADKQAYLNRNFALRGQLPAAPRKNGRWSWQQPTRRAIERDDSAVEVWKKETWPRVRAPRRSATPGSSSRTKPASR
ncbi:winged helix-turn-helix domain-containing protein [Streptomyces sp. NBC_01788]|nr:winged helix-turn-helix domain-containing protein [Streptomyces sp. NBC_01788]WSB30880.1 winged helix-turn-helix domain-containing protein [Streptomyces sp. NBC_01788]